jgi:hypothetical protein
MGLMGGGEAILTHGIGMAMRAQLQIMEKMYTEPRLG